MPLPAAGGGGDTSPRVRGKPSCWRPSAPRTGYIPARAGEASWRRPGALRRPVHPRACGGSWPLPAGCASLSGTSPRVRGKRLHDDERVRVLRYIPARAGEAYTRLHGSFRSKVHPRACGGSQVIQRAGVIVEGTSPRVRGKPTVAGEDDGPRRYIPARAGEAFSRGPPGPRFEVHPRACGGSSRFILSRSSPRGTSPRVRGKLHARAFARITLRYIPARAGEAQLVARVSVRPTVHPRACGGSSPPSPAAKSNMGTSPRVRGKHRRARCSPGRRRYIPARAGEASRPCSAARGAWVHPRACGGSQPGGRGFFRVGGTSPRVRGKPTTCGPCFQTIGYIPARAGEARHHRRRQNRTWVHPRACGGSAPSRRAQISTVGTSPRVRGKPSG